MTRLGKILVFFNMGLSVMLAAWSFNLFANGVDWPKRVKARADDLDLLWKGVAPNQTDWLLARGKLDQEEKRLADERVWYDNEIRHVLNGPAKGGKWVQEVAIASKDTQQVIGGERVLIRRGEVMLDNQGYPQLTPALDPSNAPLQLWSLSEYNGENERVLKEIETQIKKHEEQIEEAKALTDKMIGDKGRGIRGLQQRINDEQAKNAAVIAETKLVEPQLLNTLVEAQSVNKRHDQMVKRIEELKKTKVAAHKKD